MDDLKLNRHISGQFNAELEHVRNQVMIMGGLVERQLEQSLVAMMESDIELANRIIEGDKKVNAMEVSIDEECTRIIAKRQPAASDLRLIMAILKTIADLERIGDSAERIATIALDKKLDPKSTMLVNVEGMGRQLLKMLHETLDAFARMDVEAAYQVHRKDREIDQSYEALLRQLMTHMMEDPRAIPHVLTVMWAARALERIGDRCQNISEYIIYFVKGKDIRHVDNKTLRQTVARS
ncbi:phosphate signaling complex protein PhoU [Paraferrimonas sedimenticola]|uniref:Phosphate-specific transport system accessory protein PhoU n=1 Tax=Paraferrimonas sedimenticola TaxID=375674 RepID=A0AA37RTT6_9GAMM|nr:phosphate signaling complex protein PhoU [Paraferrimonas sedimenticola]GLP95209.1 phosphate transport system regulatory protein PhoU [Paraferrimonas sedimenticola]